MSTEKRPEYRKPRLRIRELPRTHLPDRAARFAVHVNGSRLPKAIGYDLGRMVEDLVRRAERRHEKAVTGWRLREARRREGES